MKRRTYWLFLTIPLLLVVCFLLFPLVVSIIPTFTIPSFGLDNYISFFADSFKRAVFFRSIRLSLMTTAICIICGVPTAYWLSLISERKRRL
ncbi:MAG: ABC transporter permease, partial [Sphaerochaetaceae bacterium]